MNELQIDIYDKHVITKFINVNGVEFELGKLLCCLEEIRRTEVDDHYGDYSLRDYELSHPGEMDKLVEMGLVKNYIGSRMANLYCMKDEKAINELINYIYEHS